MNQPAAAQPALTTVDTDQQLVDRLAANREAQDNLADEVAAHDIRHHAAEQLIIATGRSRVEAQQVYSDDPTEVHRATLDAARKNEKRAAAALEKFEQDNDPDRLMDDDAALKKAEQRILGELLVLRLGNNGPLAAEFKQLSGKLLKLLPRWYGLGLVTQGLRPATTDFNVFCRTQLPGLLPLADKQYQELMRWVRGETD